MDYVLICEQQVAGTPGGTFTSGAWRTRTLNTEVTDAGGHASVAANQITLAAGTYQIRLTAPAAFCNRHQLRLRDITNTADLIIGIPAYGSNANAGASYATVIGRIVLAGSTVLEVQHQCETTSATFGFGTEGNFGAIEVFATFEAWKQA